MEHTKKFSIHEALTHGVKTYGKHWLKSSLTVLYNLLFSIFVFAVIGAIGFLATIVFTGKLSSVSLMPVILVVIFLILFCVLIFASSYVQYGFLRFFVKLSDGDSTLSPSSIFKTKKSLYIQYVVLSLVLLLILLGGTILLIVPGIIFALMYGMSHIALVDKQTTWKDALKESKRITHGSRWKLLLYFIIVYIISLLAGLLPGALGVLVQVFIVSPIILLSTIHVYRNLQNTSSQPSQAVSPQPVEITGK